MTTTGGPGYTQEPVGPSPMPPAPPRYESRARLHDQSMAKGRLRLVVGVVVAVLVLAAGAAVAVFMFGGSEAGPQAATATFLDAVRTGDAQAAAEVSCAASATLGEHLGSQVGKDEASFGKWLKSAVAEADAIDETRSVVPVDLEFDQTSVHGRAILANEDGTWKVCSLDFDNPRAK